MTLAPCDHCGAESEPFSRYCAAHDGMPSREGARLLTTVIVVASALALVFAGIALRGCALRGGS